MAKGESTLNRWDSTQYMRIVRVEGQPRGRLEIIFADDTKVDVDGRRIVPAGVKDACWEKARPGENGFEIVIPQQNGAEIDIPWDVIRTLTDSSFAAHMCRAAEEQARAIGKQIRELRQARGLTARELAARTGITPQSVYRIERGKHDVVLTTLGKILAAMGYTYRDLVVDAGNADEEDAIDAQRR
jgi:DNA-binding XRE family transcriptional regulator